METYKEASILLQDCQSINQFFIISNIIGNACGLRIDSKEILLDQRCLV